MGGRAGVICYCVLLSDPPNLPALCGPCLWVGLGSLGKRELRASVVAQLTAKRTEHGGRVFRRTTFRQASRPAVSVVVDGSGKKRDRRNLLNLRPRRACTEARHGESRFAGSRWNTIMGL